MLIVSLKNLFTKVYPSENLNGCEYEYEYEYKYELCILFVTDLFKKKCEDSHAISSLWLRVYVSEECVLTPMTYAV